MPDYSRDVLTPVVPVRIGVCKQFVFESAGRWGCDLRNWTRNSERYLWDIHVSVRHCALAVVLFGFADACSPFGLRSQLWAEDDKWGFPYASMDQFQLVQRWLAQIPVELRIWAKKNMDWRTLLDEVIETMHKIVAGNVCLTRGVLVCAATSNGPAVHPPVIRERYAGVRRKQGVQR